MKAILTKIGLGIFGAVTGLLLFVLVALIFFRDQIFGKDGTSYGSIGELHAAMTVIDDKDAGVVASQSNREGELVQTPSPIAQGEVQDRSFVKQGGGIGGVSLRQIVAPHPNPRIIYDLQPNLNVQFQGVPVASNSCGFRGSQEFGFSKDENTFRIVFLGDSFTFGWGVEEAEIFPSVVKNILASQLNPARNVEVINLGVPGYSTFQEVALFLERGLDLKPDLVLLYFVTNDFGLPFFLGGEKRNNNILTNAVDFARDVWESSDPKYLEEKRFLRSVMDPNKSLELLADKLFRTGIPFFVAINPGKNWRRDEERLGVLRRHPWIRYLSIHERVKQLIETSGLTTRQLQLPNDPHPSGAKHKLLGEALAEGIVGLL